MESHDILNPEIAGNRAERSTSAAADVEGLDSCLARGLGHLRLLQREDGSFEGEVVWCPMILAQYVILRALLGRSIAAPERERMVRYFERSRRPEGGWGLHAESPSYLFITTLAYVALRLLGEPSDAPMLAKARGFLHEQPDGVLAIPSWGKFWLSMVGLYDYAGMNPCPPELFLLPARSPVHPNQLYCHTRYIYLAISCLYGMRFRGDLGPITSQIRHELYRTPYETIDFSLHRHNIAASDLFVAPSRLLRVIWNIMTGYERLVPRIPWLRSLRRHAIAECLRRMRFEQRSSNFQGLSPVNSILNVIALFAYDPQNSLIEPSLAGINSWRWDDLTEGIRFAGARSTSWDTAFAVLSVLVGPGIDAALVRRAYAFLDRAQEQGELAEREREARDPINGGWCFSDGRHRWPVSDCAAEALSAMLGVHSVGLIDAPSRVSVQRLDAGARFIIERQNADGGFGTYERRRGPAFLERLNPSEMFGECMTELSYVECTASAIIALCNYRESYPDRQRTAVDRAIAGGIAMLRKRQRSDGSWAGFWGINFTYATWFAVTALRAAGARSDAPELAAAAQWILSKQKIDGGWGEHYSSCLTGEYVEHPESQVVMTSWALLALLQVVGTGSPAVRRGIDWLCRVQRADGSWPEGAVNGVFFGAAMLSYRLYPVYFPIWALNRFRALSSHAANS